MRIQSRRSGRMVEESMDSLGIDSRWLDIRVTTGREEERSMTELLATSCKGKDKPPFIHFNPGTTDDLVSFSASAQPPT
uniref:Uncharacterized protein n=1 Tax=Tanacetum cinerariifolium TaxID=118510 RepID=A0A699SV48_TANCI|nr:hypothetical protein [Tanacetum cinerariifolium]